MIRKQCQMASWRTSYLMITSQITLCILLVSNSTATTQTPASTESPTTTLTTHTVDETTIQTPASTESPTTTLTTHTVDETTIEIRHTTSHTSITSHITPPSDNPTTSKLQIMTDQITSTKTDETTTTKTDETTTAKTDETTTAKTDGTTTAKTDGNASVHESTTVEPQKTVTVKTDETTHFHTSHSTAQLSTASTTNRITSAQTSSTPLTTHTPATITNANPTESTGNQNLSSTFKISMPSNGPTASNIPPISTTSLKASTKNIQTDMHSTNAMTSAQVTGKTGESTHFKNTTNMIIDTTETTSTDTIYSDNTVTSSSSPHSTTATKTTTLDISVAATSTERAVTSNHNSPSNIKFNMTGNTPTTTNIQTMSTTNLKEPTNTKPTDMNSKMTSALISGKTEDMAHSKETTEVNISITGTTLTDSTVSGYTVTDSSSLHTTTATDLSRSQLECFNFQCSGEDCLRNKTLQATKCHPVEDGSCYISKDNDIYSTGCRTGTCELEIITSSTGTEKITNCCDTVHCNNDVKLLSNMASTFSSVFALLTVSVFHTFRYYVL